MRFEILNDEQEYRRIHGLLFNRTDVDIPPVAIIGRNDSGNIVGFISGFWLGDKHFYIQWSGILPVYQGSGYLRHLKELLQEDITYELAVENTNIVTLKTVLSIGFIPVGGILQGSKYFVQLKREAT